MTQTSNFAKLNDTNTIVPVINQTDKMIDVIINGEQKRFAKSCISFIDNKNYVNNLKDIVFVYDLNLQSKCKIVHFDEKTKEIHVQYSVNKNLEYIIENVDPLNIAIDYSVYNPVEGDFVTIRDEFLQNSLLKDKLFCVKSLSPTYKDDQLVVIYTEDELYLKVSSEHLVPSTKKFASDVKNQTEKLLTDLGIEKSFATKLANSIKNIEAVSTEPEVKQFLTKLKIDIKGKSKSLSYYIAVEGNFSNAVSNGSPREYLEYLQYLDKSSMPQYLDCLNSSLRSFLKNAANYDVIKSSNFFETLPSEYFSKSVIVDLFNHYSSNSTDVKFKTLRDLMISKSPDLFMKMLNISDINTISDEMLKDNYKNINYSDYFNNKGLASFTTLIAKLISLGCQLSIEAQTNILARLAEVKDPSVFEFIKSISNNFEWNESTLTALGLGHNSRLKWIVKAKSIPTSFLKNASFNILDALKKHPKRRGETEGTIVYLETLLDEESSGQ